VQLNARPSAAAGRAAGRSGVLWIGALRNCEAPRRERRRRPFREAGGCGRGRAGYFRFPFSAGARSPLGNASWKRASRGACRLCRWLYGRSGHFSLTRAAYDAKSPGIGARPAAVRRKWRLVRALRRHPAVSSPGLLPMTVCERPLGSRRLGLLRAGTLRQPQRLGTGLFVTGHRSGDARALVSRIGGRGESAASEAVWPIGGGAASPAGRANEWLVHPRGGIGTPAYIQPHHPVGSCWFSHRPRRAISVPVRFWFWKGSRPR